MPIQLMRTLGVKKIAGFLCVTALLSSLWTASAAQLTVPEGDLLGPSGVAVDEDGVLYVADEKANAIFQIVDGDTQLFAGYILPDDSYGFPTGGYLDGVAEYALFNDPTALAFWNDGLVISDTSNNTLRFLQDGVVSTLVEEDTLYLPRGLAVDDEGTLYVADSGNGEICTVSTDGEVETYFSDLDTPCGLAWYDGVLYVTDMDSHEIFTIAEGTKTLVAGLNYLDEDLLVGGYVDGLVSVAEFSYPQGIFVDESGIYVADTGNSALRLIEGGTVRTLLAAEEESALWPAFPKDVVVLDSVAYVADPFAGVLIAVSLTETATTYADIPADSWWGESAYTMIELGMMTGTSEGIFSPDLTVTRDMVATILYRSSGATATGEDSAFSDVLADTWYTDAIIWAAEEGIVTGQSADTFGVGDGITRQDFITILYRYTTTLGLDVTVNGDLSTFEDEGSVAYYASDAMAWAVGEGLITGVTNTTLDPTGLSTRAQASVILTRWLAWMA